MCRIFMANLPVILEEDPCENGFVSKGSFDEAASRLYAALHKLDAMNLEVIIAEKCPI